MDTNFFAEVFDQMPMGVILLDHDGEVVFFNRYEERLAGRTKERVIGRNFFKEVAPCTQTSNLAQEFAAKVNDGSLAMKRMFRFTRPNIPQPRDVNLILSSIRVRDEYMGALFVQDISSIRTIEYTKDVLVRALSHDMNNPLAALMGQLQLARYALEEKKFEAIGTELRGADTACNRLRSMIKDLFDVTRLESGAIPIEYKATRVDELLTRAVERMSGISALRDISISTELEVQGAEIEADSDLIVRVVENLLENAIRFSPAGSRVKVTLRSIEDDLQFEVRDSGPGIPANLRERIFQPFFRDSQQQEETSTHRGLGLALADLIVREHGGQIMVQCPPEGGSVFSVTLPRTQPRFASVEEEAIERNRRRGSGGGLDAFFLDV